MDRPKNSQARKKSSTSRKKKQNVPSSELEMVGEMLFGNIADISQTVTPAEDTMINLGSKIAPEPMRNWNQAADSTEVPVAAPPSQAPVPVTGLMSSPPPRPEIPVAPVAAKGSSFFSRPVPMAYSLGFTALTLCIAVFLFQIFQSETPSEEEVVTTEEITTFENGEEISPVLPENTFSTESHVAVTAPMEDFPHDSASIVDSEEEVIPQFDPTLAYASDVPPTTSAEVHPAVGGNVAHANVAVSQEAYPVFQPQTVSAPVPTPTYTASTGVDVWQNQASVSYQAGSTMDEIPNYQAQAGMNNVAQYPTYAPTTPAVGSQATFSSPRKLAPPPAQGKNFPVNEAHPAEEIYPSFDPGRGVEASIPVQYR